MSDTAAEFDRVWPYLEPAVLAYGPTHDKSHVCEAIESHQAQLWALPNSALVTEIKIYPTGYKELIGWLAGGDLEEIQKAEPVVAEWAKSIGCQRSNLMCARAGWLKAFPGYREVGRTIVKEL